MSDKPLQILSEECCGNLLMSCSKPELIEKFEAELKAVFIAGLTCEIHDHNKAWEWYKSNELT